MAAKKCTNELRSVIFHVLLLILTELLYHVRRAGEEKMFEIRVLSGEIALIPLVETNHL